MKKNNALNDLEFLIGNWKTKIYNMKNTYYTRQINYEEEENLEIEKFYKFICRGNYIEFR